MGVEVLFKMVQYALTTRMSKRCLSYYNRFMGPAVGSLGKSQSNRNEDAYFNEQSINQFRKINKDGCIVKTPTDWREYERCLNGGKTCSESTYRNKHKILQEEAFFLTEQNECKKSMTKKKLEKLRESHCSEGDALSADDDSKDKP